MKRAKMMLIAIAVLATIGGALAFQADKVFRFDFCIRTISITNGITTTCTDSIEGFKVKQNETIGIVTYYTSFNLDGNCLDGEKCDVIATLVPE
jgi:hypothetical protein